MLIAGEYLFPAKPEFVWQHLLDPASLQKAIPGCKQIRSAGENQYQLEIEAGVGSIKGKFSGNIAVKDLNRPLSYQMHVDSSGKHGFIKGAGTVRLEPSGEQTNVAYSGQVQVGGVIASVGQRMIQAVAKKMANNFFEAMKRNLGQQPWPTPAADIKT